MTTRAELAEAIAMNAVIESGLNAIRYRCLFLGELQFREVLAALREHGDKVVDGTATTRDRARQ